MGARLRVLDENGNLHINCGVEAFTFVLNS